MRRVFTACRGAVPVPIALVVGGLLLSGCDGSLTVSGQLEAESCELSLWSLRGPVWAEATPTKERSANVGDAFEVHWTISGPRREHWIEVACVGYESFRTSTFQAPSPTTTLELGEVKLDHQQNVAPPTPNDRD